MLKLILISLQHQLVQYSTVSKEKQKIEICLSTYDPPY